MASASNDGGFCFDFGGSTDLTPAHPDAVAVGESGPCEALPAHSLAEFPWLTLTSSLLGEWLNDYPTTSGTGVPSAGPRKCATALDSKSPKPLQLRLPSAAAPTGGVIMVCYQTAIDIAELNRVGSSSVAAENGSETVVPPPSSGGYRDIIPGRYYGGLKVWSCAPDLASYMVAHETEWRPLLSHATVVAEIGCGQAIPGLTALCLGAPRVIFQDYNREVLERCVKPNVAATVRAAVEGGQLALEDDRAVQLVEGDWVDLGWSGPTTKISDDAGGAVTGQAAGCDVVLGSDVTFDEEACEKLAILLQRWLRPGGVAYIASKVYYFGTNGGSLEFANCAARRGLCTEEVQRVEESGGMWRVILKVTRKDA